MSFLATAAIQTASPIIEQQGHMLLNNFQHQVESQVHQTIRDQIRPHVNNYSDHPTKVAVSDVIAHVNNVVTPVNQSQ